MSGTVYVTAYQYKVDLDQFSQAIATFSVASDAIKSDFGDLKSELNSIVGEWQGPAGESFNTLQSSLASSGQQMVDLLDEMLTRMKATLQLYENTEHDNAQNMT